MKITVHKWDGLFQFLSINRYCAKDDRFFAEEVWLPAWMSARAALDHETDSKMASGHLSNTLRRMALFVGYNPDSDTWCRE